MGTVGAPVAKIPAHPACGPPGSPGHTFHMGPTLAFCADLRKAARSAGMRERAPRFGEASIGEKSDDPMAGIGSRRLRAKTISTS